MADVCKEIHATVTDRVGKLAELTDKIREAGVNIIAVCAWVEGDTGHILAVTDDSDKAYRAIEPYVDGCETGGDIVCVKAGNRPGALFEIAHKLADADIGIQLVYAAAGDAAEAAILLKTTDNARAAEIL